VLIKDGIAIGMDGGAGSDIVFLLVSFAHAWIKASVFEKHAEPQAPYARHRRGIVRAHNRFLVA
jgi:hypothetical protein